MLKWCYKCQTDKDPSEFHKNKNKKDGLQNYCKTCAKVRNHKYYLATPERNSQRQMSRVKARDRARSDVTMWLMSHPCIDCDEDDPVVLEFDHVRGTKNKNISEMVLRGNGIEAIKEEIEKCEVRCANCHRRVTARRGGWYSKEFIVPVDE
jgi:protein-arginine kinase activator protein McsA